LEFPSFLTEGAVVLDAATYKRLVREAPEAVMVRTVLEHALEAEAVDEVFENCREDQYTRTLLFSSIVQLMVLVVCRVRRSVSAAFTFYRDKLDVSLKSVYNKLNACDPSVCAGLVWHTAARMRRVMEELNVPSRPLISGYRTRIVDGNQFAATEHRIKELRTIASGPLPGKALVVFDADWGIVSDVYCSADSYTQERQMMLDVLGTVQAGELWIADRNFCTAATVWQIQESQACFIIRRHAANVRFHAAGPERCIGSTETGVVFETPIVVEDDFGGEFAARLVRVDLKSPTRDGDRSIELLTNLPDKVSALAIAPAYRQRWRIETVFFELDRVFHGEIKALGHPGAALLAFSLSLIAYNALRVVRTALAAVHGQRAADQVSEYYLTELIIADWRALDIFASPEEWTNKFAHASARAIASSLQGAAQHVDMHRIKKTTRGPKKPPPKRISNKRHPHVSTYRILKARRQVK
jgi:IS4 transposase